MQKYTLFGFSQKLDWRPLYFSEPIPAYRICNACGLLPRTTICLPCRHVLCKACYEQCLDTDAHECPLDGEQVSAEDADWRDFPLENLLRRKVKCWNEVNGCGALVSASDLLKHFDEDCVHHSTRCPKCSALILCRNVCAHRRNNCSTHVLPNEAHRQEPSQSSTPEAVFTELKVALEDGVRQLRSAFHQAVRDNTSCDRLNDFSHMVNTLRETVMNTSEKQTRAVSEAKITIVREVRDDLAAQGNRLDEVVQRIGALTENFKLVAADATKKCLNKLEEIIAEGGRQRSKDDNRSESVLRTVSTFEAILDKALERATEVIVQKCKTNGELCSASKVSDSKISETTSDVRKDHLLALNTLSITHNLFYATGLAALKDKAISSRWSLYESDPVYLCGYRISPGLYLQKNERSVSVHAHVRLLKGDADEFLQWPFSHCLKLTFVHSAPDKNRELKINRGCVTKESFVRPTESRNEGFYWYASLPLEDLEREGHIESDALCLRYDLSPPPAL
ncbi:uncharacterized protein LOC142768694 [Rhipicephalus microplus]|uniref:uncharacterized protein LOC142768694 n=1 Tax=Rhipicephalus microplus TaxID=6941 RepID=UPI003F6BF886